MDTTISHQPSASDRVFEAAADLFGLLSTPIRLRIVCELYTGERNVSDLLECVSQGRDVGVSQPNISQHLGMLYRAGVVGRRRCGAQIFYRVLSERALLLCEAVCDERKQQLAQQLRAATTQQSAQ